MIFVFGSNEAGRHGSAAAKIAKYHYGAIYGCGVGLMGTSYAIPTKDMDIKTLPLHNIYDYVKVFLSFARRYSGTYEFKVTKIGCGLAGWDNHDVAPMFELAPSNCFFDEDWYDWLGQRVKYWGTFDDKTGTETSHSST